MFFRCQTGQQGTDDGGLVGTYLAGQQDKADLVFNAVDQVGERLLVRLVQKDKLRVGGQGKGALIKAVKGAVHGLSILYLSSGYNQTGC